jgi:hypothetical protein
VLKTTRSSVQGVSLPAKAGFQPSTALRRRRQTQIKTNYSHFLTRCDANGGPGSALVEVATTIKATGVPLLEELMSLSMPEATTMAVVQITKTLVGASLGTLILGAIHAKLRQRQQTSFQPVVSTIVSVSKPALVLFPYYCVARLLTIFSALSQVASVKMRPEFALLTRGHSDMVVFVLKRSTQFLQDTSELVQISFVAWTLTRLSGRIIQAFRLRF